MSALGQKRIMCGTTRDVRFLSSVDGNDDPTSSGHVSYPPRSVTTEARAILENVRHSKIGILKRSDADLTTGLIKSPLDRGTSILHKTCGSIVLERNICASHSCSLCFEGDSQK